MTGAVLHMIKNVGAQISDSQLETLTAYLTQYLFSIKRLDLIREVLSGLGEERHFSHRRIRSLCPDEKALAAYIAA
jgi:hypothetical protein